MTPEAIFDFTRAARTGLAEAIFCEGKTPAQIASIIENAQGRLRTLLLTRLSEEAFAALPKAIQKKANYDPLSRTAVMGEIPEAKGPARAVIVTAGTADVPVAKEAARTLACCGHAVDEVYDIGVAGLWRLLDRVDELSKYDVLIMVAGMDGAIFSVLGGLVPGAIIAVPTSTGYGASRKGETALHSALASCAPGIVAVNIDSGYGAACAAARMLRT